MPKLPPPPRRAQNRSGCSSALARSTSPSAVTSSKDNDVVAGEAVFSCEPADTAAQRQACDAGLRDHARRHRQSEDVRLAIEFAQQHARLDTGAACLGIDVNPLHAGQVDDHAAVAQGAAAHVVATAAYRHEEPVFAREAHRSDDVCQPGAAGDQPRTLVDAGVPDPPRGLVLGVAVPDHGGLGRRREMVRAWRRQWAFPGCRSMSRSACVSSWRAARRSVRLRWAVGSTGERRTRPPQYFSFTKRRPFNEATSS